MVSPSSPGQVRRKFLKSEEMRRIHREAYQEEEEEYEDVDDTAWDTDEHDESNTSFSNDNDDKYSESSLVSV